MTSLNLPRIEEIDIDDLGSLPEGYRYELHDGNLFIMTPSSFWHKAMARRLLLMLHAAGANVFADPGVRGERPRDNRLPDLGVVTKLPPGLSSYANLPGSAYSLVVEIVSEHSENGEYTDKAAWYAQRGIPEYWIVDQTPDRADDDGLVLIHRLTLSGALPAYARERVLPLSDLEAEYRAERG
ncbi:Uma2 family endonuclease [Dactylosporangium sp. NPDC051541]|uniref:Uma2 family endonuclease n=1 Tax=Dactylosporangium sp. NPDC051541 TaxID=3363977 RepID=UPI0037BAD1B9